MKAAPATSLIIPPVNKEVILLQSKQNTGNHEGCARYVFANSTCKMRLFYTGAKKSLAAMKVAQATSSLISPVTKRGHFPLKQKIH
jgi:hypothetical protein